MESIEFVKDKGYLKRTYMPAKNYKIVDYSDKSDEVEYLKDSKYNKKVIVADDSTKDKVVVSDDGTYEVDDYDDSMLIFGKPGKKYGSVVYEPKEVAVKKTKPVYQHKTKVHKTDYIVDDGVSEEVVIKKVPVTPCGCLKPCGCQKCQKRYNDKNIDPYFSLCPCIKKLRDSNNLSQSQLDAVMQYIPELNLNKCPCSCNNIKSKKVKRDLKQQLTKTPNKVKCFKNCMQKFNDANLCKRICKFIEKSKFMNDSPNFSKTYSKHQPIINEIKKSKMANERQMKFFLDEEKNTETN